MKPLASTTRVAVVGRMISDYLEEIRDFFAPGAKLTLVVRQDDRLFIRSDDDNVEAVVSALRANQEAQETPRTGRPFSVDQADGESGDASRTVFGQGVA